MAARAAQPPRRRGPGEEGAALAQASPSLGALAANEDDLLMGVRRRVAVPGVPAYANEAEFQAAVRELATFCGWLCHCVYDSRKSPEGWPDLFLVGRGTALALELKMPGRQPTPMQAFWLQALRAVGIPARVVYPADIGWIEDVLTGKETLRHG